MKTGAVKTGVVIVAAGSGTRLGAGIPKALVELGGETLVHHAARRFAATGSVSHIVAVVASSHEEQFRTVLSDVELPGGEVRVVTGGAERSDSVRCGLRALNRECDVVLIHDAARALVPREVIERVIRAVEAGADAVVPAVPVSDTIKEVVLCESPSVDGSEAGVAREVPANGINGQRLNAANAAPTDDGVLVAEIERSVGARLERVVATPERANLRAIQTPQGFRRSSLVAAHESGLDATDDAALVERWGGEVFVVPGDIRAMKITTPLDIVLAEHLLGQEQAQNM